MHRAAIERGVVAAEGAVAQGEGAEVEQAAAIVAGAVGEGKMRDAHVAGAFDDEVSFLHARSHRDRDAGAARQTLQRDLTADAQGGLVSRIVPAVAERDGLSSEGRRKGDGSLSA